MDCDDNNELAMVKGAEMTRERADEIVRMVIYNNIGKLDIEHIDAFKVGRIIGFIQKDLERELSKEVIMEQINDSL
ncbi:MAG: hypothetical protein KBT27_02635 [Prevotellaceae bacterium]|nr:hypothetical protein [Candidatus Faecinaster equi]